MSKFILLLRGINVGKGNRLPMAGLRSLLEAQGFTGVQTILNSGNAVFDADTEPADKLAEVIHADILEKFGLDIHTHVLSSTQLNKIIIENTLLPLASDHSRLLVVFARDHSALEALAELEDLLVAGEHFTIGKNAAYLLCPNGISESRFAGAMLGKYGKSLTSRNWNTIMKVEKAVN